jgi:hypothetical protein
MLRGRVIVVLASILVFASILATWIRAQVIDTEGWTQTSVRLLHNSTVRETLADALGERVLVVLDAQKLAERHLRAQLAPLAGVLSTSASQAVAVAIDRALESSEVQSLWASANRSAHAEVIALLNGGSSTLSTQGGVVTIDVGALLDQLGSKLGLGSGITDKLPPARRQILLFRSNQLRTAQNGVKGLRDLSVLLPVLAILLYIAAIALSPGLRRRILLEIGVGIVAASLLALLLRRWVESYVVNNLIHSPGIRPAIREVAAIATEGWQSRAIWLLLTGALIILAATLAGPMRGARWLRSGVAKPLRLRDPSAP